MAGVNDFKALLKDLVFVLITIHSSALFKIYLYILRYRDILKYYYYYYLFILHTSLIDYSRGWCF
jgi:hypothetical protein